MKLRRMIAVGAVVAGAVVVPASAALACPTGVYAPTSDGVGVCVEQLGYVAAGVNGENEVYAIASNDELGYVGVSNYENGDETTECANTTNEGDPEGGSGTNSGGCYGGNSGATNVHALPVVGPLLESVPLPVCGDNSGPFENSSRDGCRNSGLNEASELVCGLLEVLMLQDCTS